MGNKTKPFAIISEEQKIRAALESTFAASMMADGISINRHKMANGIPVRGILELAAFEKFWDPQTPQEALERYALEVGYRAGLGWVVQNIAHNKADVDLPGLGTLEKAVRVGLFGKGFKM